ncbi:hypothetical protein BJ546DRAFT_641121 [Cryomyces antarcticus]
MRVRRNFWCTVLPAATLQMLSCSRDCCHQASYWDATMLEISKLSLDPPFVKYCIVIPRATSTDLRRPCATDGETSGYGGWYIESSAVPTCFAQYIRSRTQIHLTVKASSRGGEPGSGQENRKCCVALGSPHDVLRFVFAEIKLRVWQ